MAAKTTAYVPSMSDAAVKAKTGKTWAQWFAVLDKAGAAKVGHGAIAEILSRDHGIGPWWCQMVTVEYERARGLRLRHETKSGFSVAITKTVGTSLSELYEWTANAAKRRKWFPKGAFELSTKTTEKYFRGSWNTAARLEIGFSAKGESKAQIAVQVSKLAKEADVAAQRALWKQALEKLAALSQAGKS